MLQGVLHWVDRNILELGRELRLSYLPPLMVYLAAGVSGLTGIVGTFFVKDYLGLSAEFLAMLGFWAGIPWALKMPLGHLVDLMWRWKSALVFLGAGLITVSLLIMLLLLSDREGMAQVMSVEAWYVISVLLAPVGYVLQDVVADAMTVEAIPRFGADGHSIPAGTRRLMHTTMQTLGRVAIIGGGVLVSVVNIAKFAGVAQMPESAKLDAYIGIYRMALIIPVVSVLGVTLGGLLKLRDLRRYRAAGFSRAEARAMVEMGQETTQPNWWILGGSLAFVAFTLVIGLGDNVYSQEIVFAV